MNQIHSLVDAMFDTTSTALAADREIAASGRKWTAGDYIATWQRLDDEATGKRRAPIQVVATVGYRGRHRA